MGGNKERLLAAVMLAPPLALLVVLGLVTTWIAISHHTADTPFFGGYILSVAVGYLATLMLGLPIHSCLLRVRWTNAVAYTLLGDAAGGAVLLIIDAWVHALTRPEDWYAGTAAEVSYAYAIFAACGGATSLVFWLIRRPDRDSISSVIPDGPRGVKDYGG